MAKKVGFVYWGSIFTSQAAIWLIPLPFGINLVIGKKKG